MLGVVIVSKQTSAAWANIVGGIVVLALFFVLGNSVSHNGEPAWLVPIENPLRGKSQLIAWWFTWLGYAYVLVPLMTASLVAGIIKREWLTRAVVPVPLTIVAWQLADFFQHRYHRLRPPLWYVKHETAFSYPSSHAAIAIAFYAFWALLLWRSELAPRTRAIGAALGVVLAAGIIWSRLALGAHYATDLTGGALLAAGLALLMLGLLAAFGISLWPRGARTLKVRTDPEPLSR